MMKINYEWSTFEWDINGLAKELKPFKPFIKNIYGIPRGGLVVAVKLSHLLDIPVILEKDKIGAKTLIVDDIADSGTTLKKLTRNKLFYKTAVLWLDEQSKFDPNFYVNKKSAAEGWIIFPWETAKTSKYDNII